MWTAGPRQAQRDRRGPQALHRRDRRARRQRHASGPPGTLDELVKPFANRKVGGVTTNQRIIDYDRNVLTRWADWLESIRDPVLDARDERARSGRLPARAARSRSAGSSSTTRCPAFLERAVPRRVPRGERRPHADEPLPPAGLPDRVPVDELRLHRRAGRHAQAGEAAAPLGARQSVQHAADAALDDAQHADARAVLHVRHRDAVPAARRGHRLRLPSDATARTSTSTRGSRSATDRSWAPRSSSCSRCWRRGSPRTSARAGTSTNGHATCGCCRCSRVLNTFMLMPIRIYGFMRMAKNDGWGTRRNAFDGERVKTRPNPYAAIPVRARVRLRPDRGCIPWVSAASSR